MRSEYQVKRDRRVAAIHRGCGAARHYARLGQSRLQRIIGLLEATRESRSKPMSRCSSKSFASVRRIWSGTARKISFLSRVNVPVLSVDPKELEVGAGKELLRIGPKPKESQQPSAPRSGSTSEAL